MQTQQFLLLRRRLSSGGEKPGQFSAFGRETSATLKVTVIQLQEQLNIFSNNRYFCYRRQARQRYLASQRPTVLPTELSGYPVCTLRHPLKTFIEHRAYIGSDSRNYLDIGLYALYQKNSATFMSTHHPNSAVSITN